VDIGKANVGVAVVYPGQDRQPERRSSPNTIW
jgi:hypothetical protein